MIREKLVSVFSMPLSSDMLVYVSFDGLADLLCGPNFHQEPLAISTATTAANKPNAVTKWPKMDLWMFCEQFDIPKILEAGLQQLAIQGPHVLSWIKDDDLHREGQLSLGELETVVTILFLIYLIHASPTYASLPLHCFILSMRCHPFPFLQVLSLSAAFSYSSYLHAAFPFLHVSLFTQPLSPSI